MKTATLKRRYRLLFALGCTLVPLTENAFAAACPINYYWDGYSCQPTFPPGQVPPPLEPGKPINPNPGQPLTQDQLKAFAPTIINLPEAKRGTVRISSSISNRIGAVTQPRIGLAQSRVPVPQQPSGGQSLRPPPPLGAPQQGPPPSGGAAPKPGEGPGRPMDSPTDGLDDKRSALPTRGLAAGDGGNKHGVWGNIQYSKNTDKSVETLDTTTASTVGTMGYDLKINDKVMVGLALLHDNSRTIIADIDRVENTTLSAVPYLAYRINDLISVDSLVGWSNTNDEQNVSDSRRWMAAAGLNGFYVHNHWLFSGRIGYMVSDTETKLTSIKTRFDQATLHGEASYTLDNLGIPAIEPYVGVSVEQDMRHEGTAADYDASGVLWNGGTRFQFTPSLTSEIKYETNQERRAIQESSFMGNIRYEF